jgi:hypothetical protein
VRANEAGKVIITLAKRPDWYTWSDPPFEWCQQNVDLPGLIPGIANGRLIVDFHISHTPCLPEEGQIVVNQIPRYYRPIDMGLMRSYQAADYMRFDSYRGALIAYAMRVGKSCLAAHLHDPSTGILVITGPLATREAWRDWVGRTFDFPLCCLEGRLNVEQPLGYPAYFCHCDILAAHGDFFQRQRIGTFVLDEIHMWQSKFSQRVGAASLIAPSAHKVLGLSGTPIWNKPKSLYPLLHLLMPGAWGTPFVFKKRYCNAQPGAHGWIYEGVSNAEELRARLDYVMVRRTWEDVMPDLPPTTRILEPVALTGAQYTSIEAATMKATLAMGGGNEAAYRAQLQRKLAALKIKPAIETAKQAVTDGHKVVLWAWHNEIADKIATALPPENTFRLRSADSANVRDWNVEAFRAWDGSAFMVASMGVAGVGLDLSCSDYAIFVELDWTPATNQQAEARTFHKDRPHIVVVFYTDDPLESRLLEVLDAKNGFAGALGLGANDVMQKVLG